MTIPKEIVICLKDEDKTLREKFLVYDDVLADSEHPIIKNCIQKALENFKGKPDDVSVKISFQA